MMQDVRVPEIGEHIESGEVVKVLVAVGDVVTVDQPLAELETDKAVVEFPSPVAGRVTKVLMRAGEKVSIGQVVLQVESSATVVPPGGPVRETASPPRASGGAKGLRDGEPERGSPTGRPPVLPPSLSPLATTSDAEVAASPAVRRLARELGVDLNRVAGSGTSGRISPDDVKEFVRRTLGARVEGTEETAGPPAPDFERSGSVSREPLSKVRRLTGENLTASWRTVPQVTQFDLADITELETFRRTASGRIEAQGGKLTLTAILTLVCGKALRVFPQFNGSLDWPARERVLKHYCHIGIAVDTEHGLIVPVVRDADRKSLTELAVEIHELAARTRERKVRPDELEGGNFTISNLGGIGGTWFSPLVYAPQVAILGMARTRLELRMIEGQILERRVLPLALSYDHRAVDGAEGARFLRWIVEALENPYLAVLGA